MHQILQILQQEVDLYIMEILIKNLNTGLEESTLIIAPVPDQNYTTELHYLYKPTSLVTDTTGTWMSEHARNALLYGVLVEAYTFMKGDPDMMNLYENRFQSRNG